MTTQPEALRLANECDTGYPLEEDAKHAAAELRRLHSLTLALELAESLESDDSSVSCMEAAASELRRLHEENKALRREVGSLSANALDDYRAKEKLLEALKEMLTMPEADGTFSTGKLRKTIKDQARSAIAKETGGAA